MPVIDDLEIAVEGDQSAGKKPAMLLVPGLHSDLHEWGYFDAISDRLVKLGLTVWRFSFSGSGRSGGTVYDLTLTRQAAELRTVIDHVLNQKSVDKSRFGVLAQSFGVPTTIAALPLPAKTLVFTSGAYYPEKSIAKLFTDLGEYHPDGDSFIKSDYDSFTIGPQLWSDLSQYNLMKKMQLVNQPVLIAHGKKDFIDWHWAVEAYDAVSGEKQLALHDEVEHGFEDKPEYFDWLMARVEPWLKKTLI